MDDSEKPFACTSPGCNMSFANEDHLVVHKKKHDMILNLGNNGKSTFVADQTPTPTRFIRNCEEVGLFQDLQNVNPFEETFRRAVEDGKTGSALSETEGVSGIDDTLHTPHIFPNIADPSVVIVDTDVTKEIKETTSSNEEISNQRDIASKSPEIIVNSKKSVETSRIVVQEADTSVEPKIIDTTRTATNLSINGQEVQLLLKTADGKLMQLSAVPLIGDKRNETFQIDAIEARGIVTKADDSLDDLKKIASSNSSSSRLSLAKMRLRQTLTKNTSLSSPTAEFKNNSKLDIERKNERNNDKTCTSTEQRRKQDVLARNRASSMRAREKRKAWIQQLQRTAGNANERNATLQLEVKALRSEVARLRALLLAHENCPVTRSMEKGSLVGIQTKSSSIVQTLVQNVQTSQTNPVQRLKRISSQNETPIAPKITKLSSISSNHHVILPKIATIPRELVSDKDFTRFKIVDVRTIQTSKNETSKKILLVDNNTPRRLEYSRMSASSCKTIRVNPTCLRIDNAASKCTGT